MIKLRPLLWLLLALANPLAAFAAPAETEPAIRTLFLIRHGMYESQPGVDESIGSGLTALGREQAESTAAHLANLPMKFDAITSSERTRARQTADIIAAKLGLTCARDGLLNECSPVRIDQPSTAEQVAADAQLVRAWGRYTTPVAGKSTRELLVCHGNVIRWFVCRALGVDTRSWIHLEIANCSITIIQVRPDGFTRVQMFNDISHVPIEKQTWSGRGPGWPLPAQAKTK